MSHSQFDSADWYRALALPERRATQQDRLRSIPAAFDLDRANRRLQRWRAQTPFAEDAHFYQRLVLDNITQEELLYLLGESAENLRAAIGDLPDWLTTLKQAFEWTLDDDWPVILQDLPPQPLLGFLNLCAPLIRQGRQRLREGIQALPDAANPPFDLATIEAILSVSLPDRLLPLLERTLALELNVARYQGVLQGDTAEERFLDFVRRLLRPEVALTLLLEYPVLARQLVEAIDAWVATSLEFLTRLCLDWEAIQATFNLVASPGVIAELSGDAGDRHRGGRAVMLVRFTGGLRLVYKPRSLAVEAHFQELLAWLNARGADPTFRTLKIVERGAYGWVEFVERQDCATLQAVERFYRRQGGYLALLYALEATDSHYDNLIAAGEEPVWIDLEALFHPRAQDAHGRPADGLEGYTMAYSVLRVGLLPQLVWSNDKFAGIDISGLGGLPGQLSPQGIPVWHSMGTDEMRLERQQVEMAGGRNRPKLNGADVSVLDYTQAILDGFTHIYHLLLRHRADLLADGGPLSRFATDEVRVIVRATRLYGLLLYESSHPDLLRDALDRDRFLDKLWLGVDSRPYLARTISAECADLRRGDIPLFVTQPGSRTIWSSAHEPLPDFFAESGLDLVRQRLQRLDAADMVRQTWFIRAALTLLSTHTERVPPVTPSPIVPDVLADRTDFLVAAQAIGDRLAELAIWEAEGVSWIVLTLTRDRRWTLTQADITLYDGLPGITLFLAYLGEITGQERYRALAQQAWKALQRQIDAGRPRFQALGAFVGWGGVIYTLTHLAILWQQLPLLQMAEDLVELLPSLIQQDEAFDIIEGSAGCLLALLGLHRLRPSERTLTTAIQCGDRLLACAQPMDQGLGWVTPVGPIPLAGLSHGAAGIAWSLFALATVTGAERFRVAALAALTYERTLFSPEKKNWCDLRQFQAPGRSAADKQANYMVAWCHGAPGIGLARLRLLPFLDDPTLHAEIDAALQTTLAHGCGRNHSLCHGDLGNLELLLQARLSLSFPPWDDQIGRLASTILHHVHEAGWLCGNPAGIESPGLMTGLAGIGLQWLRLAEPTRVPAVLILEPPTIPLDFAPPHIP